VSIACVCWLVHGDRCAASEWFMCYVLVQWSAMRAYAFLVGATVLVVDECVLAVPLRKVCCELVIQAVNDVSLPTVVDCEVTHLCSLKSECPLPVCAGWSMGGASGLPMDDVRLPMLRYSSAECNEEIRSPCWRNRVGCRCMYVCIRCVLAGWSMAKGAVRASASGNEWCAATDAC
jgi:hypothetical protein